MGAFFAEGDHDRGGQNPPKSPFTKGGLQLSRFKKRDRGDFRTSLAVIQTLGYHALNPWVWAHKTQLDRKSTRLNSSHKPISYAVFCLKKKN